jgi:glycosyltransferase involved in cell wall biosynthesis
MFKGVDYRLAVVIPCYNEEKTIGKVISDFQKYLPEAKIYVGDNNSTDKTAQFAKEMGVCIIEDMRKGKGNMMQTLFKVVEADYYILVDGDDTYFPEEANLLLQPLFENRCDTTVGNRHFNEQYASLNSRKFHGFGNKLVIELINKLFNANLSDIMSGYRGFTRNYVKSLPIISSGFEVETEMTLNTLENNFRILEVPIKYQERPEGSFSKLNTFSDGYKVLLSIIHIFKDYRPLFFYSIFASVSLFIGLGFVSIPVLEYFEYKFVFRVPSLIFGLGFILISLIFMNIALILDTQRKYHKLIMNNLINNSNV